MCRGGGLKGAGKLRMSPIIKVLGQFLPKKLFINDSLSEVPWEGVRSNHFQTVQKKFVPNCCGGGIWDIFPCLTDFDFGNHHYDKIENYGTDFI